MSWHWRLLHKYTKYILAPFKTVEYYFWTRRMYGPHGEATRRDPQHAYLADYKPSWKQCWKDVVGDKK